ncbi:MAG: formate C-acetyltransferase/glycerol dehydratase family glycyl radical enzyme [Anaerolineaceae bacterium]|nr:formate C-acetyltransferase/glycerol dehydratase family glycyl radical enzyme [Anaerolineaceae bacterium]
MLLKLSGSQSDRVQSLRSRLVQSVPGICPERARTYTQAYRQYSNEPPILLRAKALKAYLENVSLEITPDDLIPGWQSSHPRWAPIFPEYSWKWIYDELDTFEKRRYDRFSITTAAKEELRQVLPWWEGRTLFDRIAARQPDFVKDAAGLGVISWTGQATSGEGHIVVDHRLALEQGFAGLKQQAQQRCQELPLYEPESLSKRDFYDAVEIVCDAVMAYAGRLSHTLAEAAAVEALPERRQELLGLAEDLRTVPANPAGSFRQALLTVWLVHLIQQMESNGHSVSLGRFDQYLYPYYAADLEGGRITPEGALELLEHFYLKVFSIIKLRTENHSRTQTGYPTYQNLMVGGQDTQGRDVTNPLSYLCLAALAEVRLSEPNFYIRLHPGTPPDFLEEALRVVRMGFGMPAFVNDQVVIPSFEQRGVSHADAMNYSTMGCVEVLIPGKWGYRANGKSKLNVLKVLELALNDGQDPQSGLQLKKGHGTLQDMRTFDEVLAAWREQLLYYTQAHVTADNINDQALEQMVPNAFCSLLVHDCLERGCHLNAGGAVYDMTSGCLVGIPNVGNALVALKTVVYDQKLLPPGEVLQARKEDFAGKRGEEIRQILLHRAPKYGEDCDTADELTATALEDYCLLIEQFHDMRYGRGPIGGTYFASTNTVSQNITAGDVVGATPDGRKKGEPTADGVSPSQGTGRAGPTAIFQSVGKLPTVMVTGGQLLNMRLTPESLGTETGVHKLAALLQAFFEMDGWHVQFNTVSTELLKDAMRHPENYPDLIVRVAGYSALFVALDPALQSDIIARMEYAL